VRRWMLRDPDDVPATRISNSRALSSDDRR
jgi:hypothetical protein